MVSRLRSDAKTRKSRAGAVFHHHGESPSAFQPARQDYLIGPIMIGISLMRAMSLRLGTEVTVHIEI